MNTKRKWAAALIAALGLAWAGAAQANTPSEDSLTVTVSPIAAYSMTLSTGLAANSFALGSVGLGLSTFTVNPATVTITSSYATTGLTLQGLLSGGWSLETGNTGLKALDKLAAWAVFTDTGVSLASSVAGYGGAFGGTAANANSSGVLSGTAYGVGNATTPGTAMFVETAGQPNYKSMYHLPTQVVDAGGSMAHLWLKLTLPNTTTSNTQKSLTVVVTAAAPID